MKPTRKMLRLLERIKAVERMERGKLCQMTGRPHYNHQTWLGGRNEVCYVPADDIEALRQAIAGYRRFCELTEAYADEVIARTRRLRPKPSSKS